MSLPFFMSTIKQESDDFFYLLDEYPDNAIMAYSFRKLRSDYTGFCCRIERSSDNTQQDFGFASNKIVDINAIDAWVGSGIGRVRTWYDQSLSVRNWTSTTYNEAPLLINNGVYTSSLTGIPLLRFESARTTSLRAVSGSTVNFGRFDDKTIFSFIKNSGTGFMLNLTTRSGTLSNGWVIRLNQTAQVYAIIGGTTINGTTNFSAVDEAVMVMIHDYNTSLNFEFDDTTFITGTTVSGGAEFDLYQVGRDANTQLTNSFLGEHIHYFEAKPSLEVTAIKDNIKSFWTT
jgi:hypothetical protein